MVYLFEPRDFCFVELVYNYTLRAFNTMKNLRTSDLALFGHWPPEQEWVVRYNLKTSKRLVLV